MNSASSGPAIWSAALQVCSYDVDVTRRATAQALCRYFLEAAWNHAEARGVGFSHLAAQDRVWVLSRLLFRIQGRPNWSEKVSLNTWPRGVQSLFAMRDFEFLDSSGTVVAAGTTGWLVLKLRTRRPQRLDFLPRAVQDLPTKRALDREPEKLPAAQLTTDPMRCTARPSDIDVNAHVNSARYLDWILDTYPLEFHRLQTIEAVEVNYLGETLLGDHLEVRSLENTAGLWFHSLTKSSKSRKNQR